MICLPLLDLDGASVEIRFQDKLASRWIKLHQATDDRERLNTIRHRFTNYESILEAIEPCDRDYLIIKDAFNALIEERFQLNQPDPVAVRTLQQQERQQQEAIALIQVGQTYRIIKPGSKFGRFGTCEAKNDKYAKVAGNWFNPLNLELIEN